MEVSDRRTVLPGWVLPAAGFIGFAWGVNRLRRGDSSLVTWGVTAVTLPLAMTAMARIANRRATKVEEHGGAVRERHPVAAAVGSALSGMMGAMVAR